MTKTDIKDYSEFELPVSVVSRVDISRLVREFEWLDNVMTAKVVREKAGAKGEDVPPMSPQLTTFLDLNPVELGNTTKRSTYIKLMRVLKDKAPVVHMTFAVVADPESLQQLAQWYRESVHPQTVIDAHLQPALVAGVYLRTPNHVFDLSVRNALKSKHGELVDALGAGRKSAKPKTPVTVGAPVTPAATPARETLVVPKRPVTPTHAAGGIPIATSKGRV